MNLDIALDIVALILIQNFKITKGFKVHQTYSLEVIQYCPHSLLNLDDFQMVMADLKTNALLN